MEHSEQKMIFRKKALDRIASPEQLSDYLCVTNPGIWSILAAVILFLAGLFAWSAIGTLETTAEVKVIVEAHTAQIIPMGAETVENGMPLQVASQEFYIASVGEDEYGRSFGLADVSLPDGVYNGTVVVAQTHPIDFLLGTGDP